MTTVIGPQTQIGGAAVSSVTAADASIVIAGTASNPTITVGVITDSDHGSRSGGALHANVIASGAAGFMTGADKASLDALVSGTVPSSRQIISGAGLTGGGDLSTNRTLAVGANADGSIVVNTDDVQVGILATDAQHGNRGSGALHANVIAAGAAGFMSGTDKTKLDGVGAGATVAAVSAADTSIVIAGTAANPTIATGATIPTATTFSAAGSALLVTNNVVVGGVVSHALGSAAAPSITLTGDLDTGIYSPSADQIGFATSGAARLVIGDSAFVLTPLAASSGSPTGFTYTAPAHTNLTASTENVGVSWDLSSTKTFAAGAIATQRAFRILAPTYAFASASTISAAATVEISAAPIAGSNATITESVALLITSGSIALPQGTVTAPALAFAGDPNTGIYSTGDNIFNIATGGANAVSITASIITTTLPQRAQSGTNTAPAYSFTTDTGTGMYRSGTNTIGFATNGTLALSISTAAVVNALAHSASLGSVTAPGYAFTGRLDLGLYSSAGNTLDVATNGVNRLSINTTAIISSIPYQSSSSGTAGAPIFSFSGDTNTGMYRVTTDQLGFAANGTLQLTVTGTAIVSTVHYSTTLGTVSAPSYSFTGNLQTGIYSSATDNVDVAIAGVNRFNVNAAAVNMTPGNPASGAVVPWLYTCPALTLVTAGSEVIQFSVNTGVTIQHASNTAVTTQRATVFAAPTYSFQTATGTITTAATVAITGAPVVGTNAAITTSLAFWVQGGASRFDGNIGFFSTAPAAQQTIGAVTNNVTAGGSTGTIANYTDLTLYANDAAAIRNNIYQLARSVAQIATADRAYGLGA